MKVWIMVQLLLWGILLGVWAAWTPSVALRATEVDQYPFAANKHARYLWHERIGQNQYVALVQVDTGTCIYWLSEYPVATKVALSILPATCPAAERPQGGK